MVVDYHEGYLANYREQQSAKALYDFGKINTLTRRPQSQRQCLVLRVLRPEQAVA